MEIGEVLEKQLVTVKGHLAYKHLYNQHDQNTIIILPGDLLFAFQSPHHEHTSNETLILRSLPSLNTLLREVGDAISAEEIIASFKFIGSCLCDWAVSDETPFLRGIDIVHSGYMKVVNVFDDVTQRTPMLAKTLPRHAFLWLRPCMMDPQTQRVVPYNAAVVPMNRGPGAAAVAAGADVDEHLVLHGYSAEPEDEKALLAELDDWGMEAKVAQPGNQQAAANAAPAGPARPRYFWQYVPVCSTHADLQYGGRSAALRDTDNGQRWFEAYNYAIYVGHMLQRPNRIPPKPLDSDIMQFTVYGTSFGTRLRYDSIMCDQRHMLQSIEIDTQNM